MGIRAQYIVGGVKRCEALFSGYEQRGRANEGRMGPL